VCAVVPPTHSLDFDNDSEKEVGAEVPLTETASNPLRTILLQLSSNVGLGPAGTIWASQQAACCIVVCLWCGFSVEDERT
jgi:hypothetical protein